MKTKRPFTMVRRSIWRSVRFRALPSEGARLLYLYLLTCEHQRPAGCFALRASYVTDDLSMPGGAWDADRLNAELVALEASGLIHLDTETGEVMIDRWWQDQATKSENWREGALRQCECIESERLRILALEGLEAAWRAKRGLIPTMPAAGTGAGVSQALLARVNGRAT